MTTNTTTSMTPDFDYDWLEQFEVEPAEVEAKRAKFERLAALADAGETLCLVCNWRPMAQVGDLGYGEGLCESCADLGQEQHC